MEAERNNKKRRPGVLDIVIAVLSCSLCAAPQFVFRTCGMKPDGGWMLCHWTGQAVTAIGAVVFLLSVVRFFAPSQVKWGISLSLALLAILAALLPVQVLPLCGMASMPCHTLFEPAVRLISVLLFSAVVGDMIWQRGKGMAP